MLCGAPGLEQADCLLRGTTSVCVQGRCKPQLCHTKTLDIFQLFSAAIFPPDCFPKSINTGCGMSGGSVFLIRCVVVEVLGTEGWISDANYPVKHAGTPAGFPGLWVCPGDARLHNMPRISAVLKSKFYCHPDKRLFLMCFSSNTACFCSLEC